MEKITYIKSKIKDKDEGRIFVYLETLLPMRVDGRNVYRVFNIYDMNSTITLTGTKGDKNDPKVDLVFSDNLRELVDIFIKDDKTGRLQGFNKIHDEVGAYKLVPVVYEDKNGKFKIFTKNHVDVNDPLLPMAIVEWIKTHDINDII